MDKSKTHDTIKDGNATDIVVSVPLLVPITYPGGQKTRQSTFGGEGKMLFELNNNSGPDHKRIPSGGSAPKGGIQCGLTSCLTTNVGGDESSKATVNYLTRSCPDTPKSIRVFHQ